MNLEHVASMGPGFFCTLFPDPRARKHLHIVSQGRETDIDRVLETVRDGRFIWIEESKEEIIPEETGEYGFRTE